MSPIPSVARIGRPLKYRYDTVRKGKPLTIILNEKSAQDVVREIAAIRAHVSRYGTRHGIMLVVRIIESRGAQAKVRVVWDGRRK